MQFKFYLSKQEVLRIDAHGSQTLRKWFMYIYNESDPVGI